MRSALFVPGDDEKKLAKGLASGADALIVDLEDSVAASAKARARTITTEFLRQATAKPGRPRLVVRVNPLASGLVAGATKIIALATESAVALFAMGTYRRCSRRLAGLAWGGEDLSADLGAEANRHPDGSWTSPYLLARNLTLIAAVAADVAPIDTVYTNFRDLEGLRTEALAARRDGFTGKMAIHPSQIAVINEVFTPTAAALAKAQAIIAAFAAKPDAGVVAIDGEMFDRPHLIRAQRLAARAKTRAG